MRKIVIPLVCLFFIFSAVPAHGLSQDVMVQYLIKLGKVYYQKGDFASAIHEFTKAVMVDPGNKEAQDYLRKLGAEGGYFGRSEKQVFDISKLADEIERYQKENAKKDKIADVLQLNNKALEDRLALKETENQVLKSEIKQGQKDYRVQEKMAREKGREVQALNTELTRINTRLSVVNEQIAMKQSENLGLKAKIEEVQKQAKVQSAKDQALLKHMEIALKSKTDELARLSTEKDQLNTRMETVKETISVKEAENIVLKDKIKKIQLAARIQSQKDSEALEKAAKTIESKEQQIVRLNTDYFHLKDQMVAKLVLLKEKENLLRGFGSQGAEAQKELLSKERTWAAKSSAYENEIKKLEQVFERYQKYRDSSEQDYSVQIKKLQEVVRKNRMELAFLNDRLIFTEFKLTGRDKQLGGSNKVIADLKNTLFILEKELATFQAKGVAKQADAKQITKKIEKDIDKDNLLKAQDRVIMDLKVRLAKALADVNTLGKSQEKLAALKQSLEDIKKQLEAHAAAQNKDLNTALLEAQIREIQQKINNVEGLMPSKVDENNKLEGADKDHLSMKEKGR